MIQLTRLNNKALFVNSDLIKYVEQSPDTVVTLVTGEKVVVLEKPDEVLVRIVAFRRSVLERLSPCWGKINEETKFDKNDFRNIVPRFSAENRKANQAVVDLMEKFAQQKKVTPAQIALAWLLAKKPWIVPIPGTTKLNRLEENVGALKVQLGPEDVRELDTASSKIMVQGARYPEELQKLVGR